MYVCLYTYGIQYSDSEMLYSRYENPCNYLIVRISQNQENWTWLLNIAIIMYAISEMPKMAKKN